jgi:hypothetical protein
VGQFAPANMRIKVRPYGQEDAEGWDKLTAESWNGTFLHERRFLAYHGARFQDLSLVVEDERGQMIGVFPAALHPKHTDIVVSHPGLTYGGVVHKGALRGAMMLEVLQDICGLYQEAELRWLSIPHIYQTVPCADHLYALFCLGAVRYRFDLSTAIDLDARQKTSKVRYRNLGKARRAGLSVRCGARVFRANLDGVADESHDQTQRPAGSYHPRDPLPAKQISRADQVHSGYRGP